MDYKLQSTFLFLMLHGLCLTVLCGLYVSMKGFRGKTSKKINKRLKLVYLSCFFVILTDALWQLLSYIECSIGFINYFVNIAYFVFSASGVFFWICYCLETVESRTFMSKWKMRLLMLPAAVSCAISILSPWTGWVFTLNGSEYIRGSLFFIDPIIKLSYVIGASITCLVHASREEKNYKKNRDYLLLLFSGPTIIGGIFQALLGYDFNCIALTIGLMILYVYGVSNSDKDSGDVLYSLARSYDASFIVNMDEDTIHELRVNENYSTKIRRVEENSSSYKERILDGIRHNIIPEDVYLVTKSFDIDNIKARLSESAMFSVSYRLRTKDDFIIHHQATFLKIQSWGDLNTFLLCIRQVDANDLIIQQNYELEERNIRLNKINEDIISMAAEIVEARDSDSGQHILRVKEYSRNLALQIMEDFPEYGLDQNAVSIITSASALHDIGKIMVPDAILLKPGRLTDEEFAVMKLHCENGVKVLDRLNADLSKDRLEYAKEICLWHHERYDGSGYPDGLVGDEIPISAQIVSIADCYDALTSDRVYKSAYTHEVAVQMILDGECGFFSEKLLKCFENVAEKFKEISLCNR